jgi:hypothetical protein
MSELGAHQSAATSFLYSWFITKDVGLREERL